MKETNGTESIVIGHTLCTVLTLVSMPSSWPLGALIVAGSSKQPFARSTIEVAVMAVVFIIHKVDVQVGDDSGLATCTLRPRLALSLGPDHDAPRCW